MINHLSKWALFLLLLAIIGFESGYSQSNQRVTEKVEKKLRSWKNPLTQFQNISKIHLDSVFVTANPDKLILKFAPGLSYFPFREDTYNLFTNSIKESLGRRYRKYTIEVKTNNYSLVQLIPNYYRKVIPVDTFRIPILNKDRPVLIKKVNSFEPSSGLTGNSIALWHSHGYYFEMNLDRWEWQRARLFGTVEDISVMGYVLPYLTPMLENAGAGVFLPRERDTQMHEVIVDNDKSTGNSEVVLHLNNRVVKTSTGFLLTDTLFPGYNPFRRGTSVQVQTDSAVYLPEIPEKGSYGVYISYPNYSDNSKSVHYIVSHTGGRTEYIINQSIGGETWLFLGTFDFDKGKSITSGSVTIKGPSGMNELISLDAIRFGGGMGNVARIPSPEIIKNQLSVSANLTGPVKKDLTGITDFTWKTSGKPRYLEAARYYLQYAGMPDSLVYSPNNYKNDYNDDYQSRGVWVNYLMGNPEGSAENPLIKGLGIPIDLSLGFHTDAGITPGDSVIGTLGIYSTDAGKGLFPDGKSRLASRDLSDIIQSQIVDDIRAKYNPAWTRRGLWDRPYSEARRPDVPAMLLELLSHQNLGDQKYGLDPRFRFQVSRSIYIGMLKYLTRVENRNYVVQPLPVTSFAITPLSGKRIRLSWQPVTEASEPTSKPDRYIIYKRKGDKGFDNGSIVGETVVDIELDSYDTLYSFKITAINEGGESFDSEILSTGITSSESEPVLIVNGFDRISGPAWFDVKNMAGVAWWQDRGVPDHSEISAVGEQYDFNRKSPWLDDDAPGWGASYGDMEGRVIPGNNFDYPSIHGKAILSAGHSFYSVSDEFFYSDSTTTSGFKTVDLIFGEEKATQFIGDTSKIEFQIYTPDFMKKVSSLVQSGTNIFMSGAYIGSDLFSVSDSLAIKFAGKYLHFSHRTGHAVKNGKVYATDYVKPNFYGSLNFNTGFLPAIYSVEAPDAIEPAGKGAVCAFRYSENNTSAGVLYKGINRMVILGFPYETIISESERDFMMKNILDFFKK